MEAKIWLLNHKCGSRLYNIFFYRKTKSIGAVWELGLARLYNSAPGASYLFHTHVNYHIIEHPKIT
jgi:hypothetical protein